MPLSRRAALELLGLGMAASALEPYAWAAPAAGTRIARIDVFPVRYPMRGRFKFFEGPDGSPTGRPAVLVRITDSDGAIGWGESVPIPKWSEETLETVTTTLADAGVAVLESPLRPNRIEGYQALHRQKALPILMDEGVVSAEDLVEFIHLGMLDGVAMKPARCGGLLTGRRQIDLVRDAGLQWLASGLTDPDVSLAAALALFSSYGQPQPCALNGPQFLAHSVVTRPFAPVDGRLAPPTGPGLGVTVPTHPRTSEPGHHV